MGKRELLLIAAFVLVGVVVYQATAPAPNPAQPRPSLGRLIDRIRAEIRGENAEAAVTRSAQQPVDDDITELVLDDFRGMLTLVGESRQDISAELRATVYGLDEATAQTRAKAVTLQLTPRGAQLLVDLPRSPDHGRRPHYELIVKLPARLTCSVRARGQMDLRGLAAVRLESRGKVVAHDVGAITGRLDSGSLEAQRVERIELESSRSELRIERVATSVTLDMEHGDLRLQHVNGPTHLQLDRTDAELDGLSGPITVTGKRGSLTLRGVTAPVDIKGERIGVDLTMTAAVPVTAATTDEDLVVRLPAAGVTLDAIASEGELHVGDREVAITTVAQEQRAAMPLAGGGPTVHLRNLRGAIILR